MPEPGPPAIVPGSQRGSVSEEKVSASSPVFLTKIS